MMTGTNARSKTARVESPRKLRKGPSFRARGAMSVLPQRKNPQAVESATGMIVPPYNKGVPSQ